MAEFDKIMSSLENIKKYPLEGKLETSIPDKENMLTLYELKMQVEELMKARNLILNAFDYDMSLALLKYPTKGLSIDDKKIFEEGLVKVNVESRNPNTFCLVSKTGIKKGNIFGTLIEEKINKLLPYINGLISVYEKSNILGNLFYEDLNVLLDAYIKRLIINGFGVDLKTEDFKLNDMEALEIKKYYYTNLKSILGNILVKDSTALDAYRTDIDKQEALKIYKGR